MTIQHDQVKLTHGLYQTKENVSSNFIQAMKQTRTVISQPASLGSSVVFQIPNDSLLSTVALSFQMPATSANQYLVPQFATNLVKSARVRFSSSEEIFLPLKEVFFWQMAQCASYQKQVEYIGCLGKLTPASTAAQTFYLILNLASFSSLSKRICFPAYLLQSSITVVLDLAPLNEVVLGSAASSYSPNFTMNMVCSQMVPFDSTGVMKLGANQSYTHHLKRPFALAPVITQATTDTQIQNIIGLPAGKVNSILVYAVRTTDEGNGSYQQAKPLNNLALLLNGTILHNFVGLGSADGYNCYDVLNLPGTQGVTQALINYNNGGANATDVAKYYLLPMGSEGFPENQQGEDHISNGISLASQTLQLRFNQDNANTHALHVVLFLEYKLDIFGNGQVQISPVM